MSADFFNLFLEGSRIAAPDSVLESFRDRFPEALNIEWFRNGDLFEAIFHEHGIEKISKFSAGGSWIETGINLGIERIPADVSSTAETKGEIMNAIEFKTMTSKKFEIIVRDSHMNRFLLMISSSGDLVKSRLLA